MTGTTQVLLVHGAWHGSWAWDDLLPHLEKAGMDPATVDLPSAGNGGDLAADVAAVRAALRARPGPTVLVGHSYGGTVVTEAAAGTDAVALVYVCAFQLDRGESLMAAIGGRLGPWIDVDEATGTMTVNDPVRTFYADVDPARARELSAKLVPQTLASFNDPLTVSAWRDLPSTYVVCSQDHAIPPAAQQAMSERSGTVHTLDSSHSPFLSHPAELAQLIAGSLAPKGHSAEGS